MNVLKLAGRRVTKMERMFEPDIDGERGFAMFFVGNRSVYGKSSWRGRIEIVEKNGFPF